MTAPHPGSAGVSGSQSAARYEIRLDGVLGKRWAEWFEGLQISSDGSETLICGWLPDQPALHGVLVKVRDLGLSLISVRRLNPEGTQEASPRHDTTPIPTSSAPPARHIAQEEKR
jgi:hypothetical protein